MLYKRPRSAVWWTEFTIRGQRVRKSTGATVLRQAKEEEIRLRARTQQSAPAARARGVAALSAIASADLKRALAGGATKDYLYSLGRYWDAVLDHFTPHYDITRLTHEALEHFMLTRRQAGLKGQSIIREMGCLRRAVVVAKRKKWLTDLPEFPTVRRDAPDHAQSGKLHPPEMILAVLQRIPEDARDGMLFCLMTGLRKAELRRVRASWIEPAPPGADIAAILRLPASSTKTREERIVGLTIKIMSIVERRRVKGDLLFPRSNYAKTLKAACIALGYDKVITLRDMRHTFATIAALKSGDVRATQAAMGHSDMRMTEKYLSSTILRTANLGAAVEVALFAPPAKNTQQEKSERERGLEPLSSCLGSTDAVDLIEEVVAGDVTTLPKTTGAEIVDHLQPNPQHCPHCGGVL